MASAPQRRESSVEKNSHGELSIDPVHRPESKGTTMNSSYQVTSGIDPTSRIAPLSRHFGVARAIKLEILSRQFFGHPVYFRATRAPSERSASRGKGDRIV
jgi:hypothetical protein